jgi:hypothetical protein
MKVETITARRMMNTTVLAEGVARLLSFFAASQLA